MQESKSTQSEEPEQSVSTRRHWRNALGFFLLATLICATCSWLRWPEPSVHDEFSYLLAADTFASGRLTNPTHPHWQHFESFHIIHQPSYSSKYPPGQGLFLALGQWLTGYPLAGLWILSGIGAMACYWMLLGWTSSRWALIGSLLYCVHPCYQLNWGQSYWGGTLALVGGALVFGAVPRMLKQLRVLDSIAMAMGAMVLAVSRPYEGFIFCLIIGVVVIIHWTRHGVPAWRDLILKAVLPQAAVYMACGVLLAFHNHAVTGNFAILPYQIHEETYAMSPSFLWKEPLEEKDYRHSVMTDFHHGWEMESYYYQQSIIGWLSTKLRLFVFSLQTLIPFCMLLPLMLLPFSKFKFKWTLLAVVTLSWLPSAFTVWNFPHYVAAVAPVLLLLVVLGLQQLNHFGNKYLNSRSIAHMLVACQIFVFALEVTLYARNPKHEWHWQRAAIGQKLEQTEGQHLVLVHYDKNHNPHHEWVYNRADIDGAKVVWARKVSPVSDQRLIEYFSERTIWILEADADEPRLIAYQSPGQELLASGSKELASDR